MSERIAAVVRRMRLRPTDRVLEIGCGFGVSSSLICAQLTTGSYVAVDRSATSIRAAIKRNARHVEAGRATFHVGDFQGFDPGPRQFDKILAIRVRDCHVDPAGFRARIRPWLAPGGRVFVAYDTPNAPGRPPNAKRRA